MPLPVKPRSRRPTRPVVLRLLALALALYLLPLVALWQAQQALVFNAARSRQDTAQAHEASTALPMGLARVRLQTASGEHVTAYFGDALRADGSPDADYAARPTVLFFYGKGGSLASEHCLLASLRRLDANVLMPDYIGFGQSSGQPSEEGCFATADACYAYLHRRGDIRQSRLFVAGYSLGSGVAVDLAARLSSAHAPLAGLALFAAYTSLADEAHQEYPIYPAALLRALLKYPFNSVSKMPRVTCPVLMVHSKDDTLIPFRMADALAAACGGPVGRVTVRGADHAFYFTAAGGTIFPALAHFLENPHP